jgi:glycopeptide antibiotics resistance protein
MYFQLKHCDPAAISTVTTILRPFSSTTSIINNQTQPNGQLFIPAGNLINNLHPNFTLVHLARYTL